MSLGRKNVAFLVPGIGWMRQERPRLAHVRGNALGVGQPFIERIEVIEFGHGHHEVPPAVSHQALNMPLFIRPPDQAEAMADR